MALRCGRIFHEIMHDRFVSGLKHDVCIHGACPSSFGCQNGTFPLVQMKATNRRKFKTMAEMPAAVTKQLSWKP